MPNTNCLEGIKCRKCGHEDSFKIEGHVLSLVKDDGVAEDLAGTEWTEADYCECTECSHSGKVADFTVSNWSKPKGRRERFFIGQLEVQDGEHRHTHVFKFKLTGSKKPETHVKRVASTYYDEEEGGDFNKASGWYEFECGCIAVRPEAADEITAHVYEALTVLTEL